MKKLLTIAAATLAMGFTSANAVLLDFVAEAAGNERGVASGTSFASPNFGGLTLQFDADNPARFPYFDDLAAGRPGGLGLCKALEPNGDECDDSSDDNITAGEGVTITLPEPLDITSLSFTDRQHNDLNNSALDLIIQINGGLAMQMSFAQAVLNAASGVWTDVTTIRFAAVQTDFYVNSMGVVPLPGALPLLLSGIAGLGFASRRRKKA